MTGTQPDPQRGASSPGKKPPSVETHPAHDPPPSPKPGEPNQDQPMHDPPVIPERDASKRSASKQAGGVKAPDPSPDAVIFDANKIEK